MKASEIIAGEKLSDLLDIHTLGIDVGSRQAKAVLILGDQIFTAVTASGVDAQETADRLLRKIVKQAGIQRSAIAWIVGTGYGRVAIHFDDIPSDVVTEISCHALGATSSTRAPARSSTLAGRTPRPSRSIPTMAASSSS